MRLTVIGSAASYPGAGQACSSYLIEADGGAVLLDCGTGSLSNLAKVFDPLALDAVFITHSHPDHFLDLFALQAAIRYAPSGPVPVGPIPLHMPPGLFEAMACLLDERGRDDMRAAFTCEVLREGEAVHVGPLAVTPLPVEHIPDTFALRVTDGAATLCYTADSRLGLPVREAARGAGFLLAEATLPLQYAGKAPHMTGAEAGQLASESGAGTLVLTHLWPTADRAELLAAARGAFDGEVMLATELLALEVG
jgi:ribonuclease BN (tRNA processing enzyme)